MATAKERRDIFYNVIARVGLDGDVMGEYSKAMNALNNLKTYNEMNPPIPQNLPPEGGLGTNTGQITPKMGLNTAQSESGLNVL